MWIPLINCGLDAGMSPLCWDGKAFATEQECDAWIEENEDNFTMNEIGGGVYAYEMPTLTSDETSISFYADELHELYDKIRSAKTRILEIVGCCELSGHDEEVFEKIDDLLYDAKEKLWNYVG